MRHRAVSEGAYMEWIASIAPVPAMWVKQSIGARNASPGPSNVQVAIVRHRTEFVSAHHYASVRISSQSADDCCDGMPRGCMLCVGLMR
jgi:hypothetical protein